VYEATEITEDEMREVTEDEMREVTEALIHEHGGAEARRHGDIQMLVSYRHAAYSHNACGAARCAATDRKSP
jgi:hypothetical protein